MALYQNILSQEISSKSKIITAEEIITVAKKCDSYEEIEGKEYCLKKSSITLNSCGQEFDWPCMKENGYLYNRKIHFNKLIFLLWYPRQESNLYLEFRKLLFYPLNYEGLNLKP